MAKMIFHGGKRRLMPIWATMKELLKKNYKKECEDGTIKLMFDFEKELTIETDKPQLVSEMKKDFSGIRGMLKKGQLRVAGIKVEFKE